MTESTSRATTRRAPHPLTVYAWYLIRRQWRPVVYWGIYLGSGAIWTIVFYPSFSKSDLIQQFMSAMPPSMRLVFNMTSDMSTIQGWLAFEMFNLILPIALPFYAVIIGSRSVAGAEQQRRLDLVLSSPISRWQLIAASYFEMAAGLIGILIIVGVCTWVPAQIVNANLTIGQTAAAVLNVAPIALFFGAVALLASSIARRPGVSTGIAAGILIAMYFVNGFGQFVKSLGFLRRITVFYHYGSAIEHGIAWGAWSIHLVIAIGVALLAIPAFNRRDILT